MQPNFFTRYSSLFGHLGFAVLAALAIIYYKERTIILDAAFQSFTIITRGDFAIQVHRFGAAMTQVFPLVAVKLRLPLKDILILYSLSFVLVHWAMFTICDSWLKIKPLAFGILLFNIFLVNQDFYWVQNEIIQATSLNMVFWACLIKVGSWHNIKWWHSLIGLALLATLAFFHPLIIFPFTFMAGYFFLELNKEEKTIRRNLILPAVLAFFSFIGLKIFLFQTEYDNQTTGRLNMNNLHSLFSNLTASNSFGIFMDHLLSDFYLLPVSMIILTAFYIHRKSYLKLFLLYLSVLLYITIIMASYLDANFWFHVESQYLPISIFVIVPLVWEVIPAVSTTGNGISVTVASLLLAIIIRLADINHTSGFYTKRVDFIGDSLRKIRNLKGDKFMLEESAVEKKYLLQFWGFAYETLYLSSLTSPDSAKTIFLVPNMEDYQSPLNSANSFYGMFSHFRCDELKEYLFSFRDTAETYKLITPGQWNELE
ncbi:MAG: hypothetical protein H6577_18235 [Lewinellaceae bacterium]|nr:hypothetical protein [Saprospiraceae bacterium]MCB9340065.1 hypothetical protein [Lewinellaceae bacterium]